MAETEQRFILRWSYRDLARNIGYPVGGLLLLVFIARPSGEAEDWWLLACGLAILLWTWFIDRRVRVEVTEQKVTVVNLFSRYEVPWSALHGIDLRAVGFHSGGEPLIYCLDFVTPTMETILAYMPRGNLRRMTDIRARILRARESLAIEPQSDAVIAVTGLVTVWHRLEPPAYRFEAAAANRLGLKRPRLRNALIGAAVVAFYVAVFILEAL